MFVGESWGEQEAKACQPFVGASGGVLNEILEAVNDDPTGTRPLRRLLERERVFITNVVPSRPPNNEMFRFFYSKAEVRAGTHEGELRGLYPKAIVREGLNRLRLQIEIVQPKLIVGFGNYTLWALTQDSFGIGDDDKHRTHWVPTRITSWRGSMLRTETEVAPQRVPFLPTYHPAATFHQYSWRFMIQHDLRRWTQAIDDRWDAPPWKFQVRPSFSEVMARLDNLLRLADIGPLELATDIETRLGHISCCGLAWNKLEAICIPFMTSEKGLDDVAYWQLEDEIAIVWKLVQLLTHPNVRLIGQNFLYDAQYFALFWGFLAKIFLDTLTTHHVCWPGTPRGLDYLSSLYCEHHVYWKEDGKDWQSNLGEETNWIYNCTDCVRTFEVAQREKRLVRELGMERQFRIQHDRWAMYLRMMMRGIRVDKKRRARVGLELMEAIAFRQQIIDGLLPEDVYPRERKKNGQLKKSPWYTSPAQQRTIFYDIFGIKPVTNRKTKRPTLNSEAIDILKRREPLLRPLLEPIEEMRSLSRFNDFVTMRLDPDDRMRCSYDPSGTETFRCSSSKNAFGRGGNLENISKGREDDEDGDETVYDGST